MSLYFVIYVFQKRDFAHHMFYPLLLSHSLSHSNTHLPLSSLCSCQCPRGREVFL